MAYTIASLHEKAEVVKQVIEKHGGSEYQLAQMIKRRNRGFTGNKGDGLGRFFFSPLAAPPRAAFHWVASPRLNTER